MALYSDAVMVLYYDIAGDNADHDDWHTYEHMHERLSIPGFLRGTRWTAKSGRPRYLVVYEVADVGMASSDAYLARLNDPTPWTASMMPRFGGMIRGFSAVAASSGCGFGSAAVSLRFTPAPGREAELRDRLAQEALPAMASWRGMASAHLLQSARRPPMTKEQSLRGLDAELPWVILASAYDAETVERAVTQHLGAGVLEGYGASGGVEKGTYALHYTVTAKEVARTAPNPTLAAQAQRRTGPRR